jgi:transcriptional regulator with XRE-family HTH domain
MKGRKLVAWNLRRIRVERDLSQDRLALDANVDRTYVGRLERGLENPTIGILDRLAKALSIHISEFFSEPKPGESPPKPLRSGRRSRKTVKLGNTNAPRPRSR